MQKNANHQLRRHPLRYLPAKDAARELFDDVMFDPLFDFEKIGLVEQPTIGFHKLTGNGRNAAKDLYGLSATICRLAVSGEEQKILAAINRLSEIEDAEFDRVRMIHTYEILGALRESEPKPESFTEDDLFERLVDMNRRRLIFCEVGEYPDEVRAAFLGMVRERRQENFNGAEEVDRLISEWETASVDFKRELYLSTASEKAEFIKDLIGLVNTKTSGRRWLIIGFDDNTRLLYTPPEPPAEGYWFDKTSQDKIEEGLWQQK